MESKSPFGQYLAAHEQHIHDLPVNWQSFARRLSNTPDRVGANSPTLAAFAKAINRPLTELQGFATGELLTERWVQKIQKQIANGNRNVHKKKRAAKKSHGGAMYAKHNLAKLVAEKGFTLTEATKKAGLPASSGWRASVGKMPPNHPQLKQLAAAIGIPVATIAAMQTVPPLTAEFLARAERSVAKGGRKRPAKKGGKKGIVLGSVVVDQHEHAQAHTNGKARAGGAKYNRLRKLELPAREAVRTLIATLNDGVMKGDTYIPASTQDLYLVLQDYLEEKGIKESVLVDPNYVRVFDR